MLPRFFAPDAGATGPLVTLPDDEALHLARVLRLKAGATVHVFDGKGSEWRGVVSEVTHLRARIRLIEILTPALEPRIPVTLAMAVLKGDKMDEVVRDAVMLGATAIRPLVTERTEVGLPALAKSRRLARWHRIAVASAKQCGRAVVPPVYEPVLFETLVRDPPSCQRLMLVEPGVVRAEDVRHLRDVPHPVATELVIGPEGGWTDREIEKARDGGAALVTLGGRTLRADAMPLVALTAVRVLWNDL